MNGVNAYKASKQVAKVSEVGRTPEEIAEIWSGSVLQSLGHEQPDTLISYRNALAQLSDHMADMCFEAVNAVVAAGIEIDATYDQPKGVMVERKTLLHDALLFSPWPFVEFLLRLGADPSKPKSTLMSGKVVETLSFDVILERRHPSVARHEILTVLRAWQARNSVEALLNQIPKESP